MVDYNETTVLHFQVYYVWSIECNEWAEDTIAVIDMNVDTAVQAVNGSTRHDLSAQTLRRV